MDQDGFITLMIHTTLGISIIAETLKSAAFYLTYTGSTKSVYMEHKVEEARQSLVFIQGTGLEKLIRAYNLDYNANRLRTGFYVAMNHRELID